MKVRDLMTREPLTVAADMPVGAAAALFAERGISGAPVVAATGEVLGVVTETDLERRLAAASGRTEPRSWLARLLAAAPSEARDYAKSHGRFVRDVMTPSPATIGPEASIEAAAAELDRLGVRRLPVVESDRLVGVLSRADLLRAVLDPAPTVTEPADDIALRKRLFEALRAQPWTHAYRLHFTVRDGVATFYGLGAPSEVQRGLRVLAEGVAGLRGVEFP